MVNIRGYLFRRIFQTIITIWVIATMVFVLFRLLPGDPTTMVVDPTFPAETRAALLQSFGLDRPIGEQYLHYIGNLLRGDFGISFFSREPVLEHLGSRVGNTIVLALASFLFAYPIGIVCGAFLATRRGRLSESVGLSFTLFFRSAPQFWTGMLAVTIFSFYLGWFPHSGMRSVGYIAANDFEKYFNIDFLHHLILPVVVSGLYTMTLPLLLLRNTVLETLNEDYIEMARAKGLPERQVIYRHAVRNSILPVVTAAAVNIGMALGGMTVIEVVFSWPGLGREIVQAVTRQDFPVAQGAFLLLAVMVLLMNLLADLAYAYLDPRISYH
ncbi:MAG: peptide ABC transporter permease [Anaerolineaceae bacterium]|nr:peptide ABC transporter permease [Anaerolineaceae bacterium]